MKSYKLLKKSFIASIFTTVVGVTFAFAAPLPALFYASSFDVNVGESVSFDLKVNPPADTPVYTVGATLEYDTKVLSFSDASFDKAWLPLSRNPYELTDTTNGAIVRTAGYPEGLKGTASFLHYSFKALAPGDTKVVISSGMALDANNNDLGFQQKTILVHVHGKEQKEVTKEVTPAPTKENPNPTPVTVTTKKNVAQTIELQVTGATAFDTETAYSFSVLHKLKVAQPTTGTTSYSVYNQNGAEVYKDSQTFNTSSDTDLSYVIPAGTIPKGDYNLQITSKYSDQKSPTVASKDIGVLAKGEKVVEKTVEVASTPLYVWIIFAILALVIFLMTLHTRSKAFRKFIKNF